MTMWDPPPGAAPAPDGAPPTPRIDDAFPPLPSLPTVPAERRSGLPWLVGGLVGVTVVIALLAVLFGGRDGGLPDVLGGRERITDGPTAQVLDSFSKMEFGGVRFEMAAYGDAVDPRYVVMLVNGDLPGGQAGLLESLPAGLAGNADAQIDFSRAVKETDGDTEYVCAPATTQGQTIAMTMCIEQHDGGASILMSVSGDTPRSLLPVAKELRGEI